MEKEVSKVEACHGRFLEMARPFRSDDFPVPPRFPNVASAGKGPSRGTPKLSQATCLAALRIDGTYDFKATVFVGQSSVDAALSFGAKWISPSHNLRSGHSGPWPALAYAVYLACAHMQSD
jgi:hypothetical protein